MRGRPGMRGGGGAFGQPATGAPEPPADPKETIKSILDKRIAEDKAEYNCDWQDDSRAAEWVERTALMTRSSNRNMLNLWEKELLDKVKANLLAVMESKKRVALPELGKIVQEKFPNFQLITHGLRSLSGLFRRYMRETTEVEPGAGGYVILKAEKEKIQAKMAAQELQDAQMDIVYILKKCGGKSKLSIVSAHFHLRPNREFFRLAAHQCQKFKDFVEKCPGVWVENVNTAPIRVELTDYEKGKWPEDLKEYYEQRVKEEEVNPWADADEVTIKSSGGAAWSISPRKNVRYARNVVITENMPSVGKKRPAKPP